MILEQTSKQVLDRVRSTDGIGETAEALRQQAEISALTSEMAFVVDQEVVTLTKSLVRWNRLLAWATVTLAGATTLSVVLANLKQILSLFGLSPP